MGDDHGGDADTADPPAGVSIRRATPDDHADVLRVIEGALLDVDAARIRERIAAGETLVAVSEGGVVVGALVRDGDRVVAVAVARRRRRRGIGRALVERALAATGRLTAAFAPRARGFYAALGFDVEPLSAGDGGEGSKSGDARPRLRGVRTE